MNKELHTVPSMRTHYAREVPTSEGTAVTIAGWVHELRDLGKLRFIVVRDKTGLIQVTMKKNNVPEEVFSIKLTRETVIQVQGVVHLDPQAPGGREVIPTKIEILGAVTAKMPFEVTSTRVSADLDVRLDNRYVDLRRRETTAIFNIQSEILTAFREKLLSFGFEEMRPPCIVAAATEGGTNLFPIVYFEKEAFLCQSPQLYKQMAVIGGFDRCMMLTPAFRAEKHNTPQHLNEVLQMDIEMGFADHHTVTDIEGEVLIHILKRVKENRKEDLEVLGQQDLKVPTKVKKYTYTEIVDKLNANGHRMEWGEDFSREAEKLMTEIIGEEAFFIMEFPTKIRAFYSMPKKDNPEICNSFDLIYRGLEISSGAQRIHIPELLIEQLKKRGLNPENFEFYINAFRCGAPPHAGWSIGLERLTMTICGQKNIRECTLFPRDRTRLTP